MANKLFHITAITNLHVGSGKENIGVVDNLIQRDVVTNLPVINSSSLKGALREHCNGKDFLEYVFGSEPGGTKDNKQDKKEPETTPGNYKFFDAHLLAIPARSDKSPYYMVTCPMAIKHYNETAEMFGIDVKIPVPAAKEVSTKDSNGDTYIEDNCFNLKKSEEIKTHIGSDVDVVVISDDDFKELCDDEHLPVIARNCLDSKNPNLWYEQVLPRFSVLYFPLIAAENAEKDKENAEKDIVFESFKTAVTDTLVQIGANATIGYGFCKIEDKTQSNSNTHQS